MSNNEVRTAYGRYGMDNPITGQPRIIIDECPYCGKKHVHGPSSSGPNVRLADCFQGEYKIVMKG